MSNSVVTHEVVQALLHRVNLRITLGIRCLSCTKSTKKLMATITDLTLHKERRMAETYDCRPAWTVRRRKKSYAHLLKLLIGPSSCCSSTELSIIPKSIQMRDKGKQQTGT